MFCSFFWVRYSNFVCGKLFCFYFYFFTHTSFIGGFLFLIFWPTIENFICLLIDICASGHWILHQRSYLIMGLSVLVHIIKF